MYRLESCCSLKTRQCSARCSDLGVSPSVLRLPRRFSWDSFAFCRSSTPDVRRLPVWALPFSLAATRGISFDYFSSGYLDVSVHQVCLPFGWHGFSVPGCPIRIFTALCLLAAPRDFSQLIASFFDSKRLGIRRMPFVA